MAEHVFENIKTSGQQMVQNDQNMSELVKNLTVLQDANRDIFLSIKKIVRSASDGGWLSFKQRLDPDGFFEESAELLPLCKWVSLSFRVVFY